MSRIRLEQYEGLLDVFDRDVERARLALVKQIMMLAAEFPPEAFIDPQPPLGSMGSSRHVRMFELGEFRSVWLEPLTGQTTLLIGEDHQLYEYGPAFNKKYDSFAYQKNCICIRAVNLGRLSYGDLLRCCRLLNRIWL